jgi:hypothetical protein
MTDNNLNEKERNSNYEQKTSTNPLTKSFPSLPKKKYNNKTIYYQNNTKKPINIKQEKSVKTKRLYFSK